MLALLIAHFNEMACIKLWLKSGTSAKPNYMCSYNLRDICHFPRGSDQHYTIPCDHWILLAVESDQLGMHSVRILTSLQILVRVIFISKHIQVTPEVNLQDVQSF